MTPKEKAKELVEKMSMGEEFKGSLELMELYPIPKNKYAKECALIAVDEVLNDLKESLEIAEDLHLHAKGLIAGSLVAWQKVKIEIENH